MPRTLCFHIINISLVTDGDCDAPFPYTFGVLEHMQGRSTRGFWDAMRPFMTAGVYVNYLEDEADPLARDAYGPNYDRMVALKNKYDPTNFFRMNHNIKPSQAVPSAISA